MVVGLQQVHLMPGDFIFGRHAASNELGMSERTIRTSLDSLRKRQNVTIKTTNKFSIITIVNWHTYQSEEITNDQQNDQPVTSKRPASDHKQECKEHKNVKKKDMGIFNSDNFEKFYSEYPVHTGKAPTLEKWKKKLKDGTLPELNILLEAIGRQRAWRENTTEFRPAWKNPASWLHQECWTDEITSYGGNNGNNRKFTSEKPISRQDREQADEAERINREYREAKAREATGQAT